MLDLPGDSAAWVFAMLSGSSICQSAWPCTRKGIQKPSQSISNCVHLRAAESTHESLRERPQASQASSVIEQALPSPFGKDLSAATWPAIKLESMDEEL